MKDIRFIGPDRILSAVKTATLEDCINYCQSKKILGLDVETEGLDYTTHKMVMLQIGDENRQYVIDTRSEKIGLLSPIFLSMKITKVLHNVKFDHKFLLQIGMDLENIYDTQTVEQAYYCGDKSVRCRLDDLTSRYFDKKLSKDLRMSFTRMHGQPFTDAQIVYGAEDVEYLPQIVKKQAPLIAEKGLEEVVRLENEVSLAFSDIEWNGLDIDPEPWLAISKESEKEVDTYLDALDKEVLGDPRFASHVAKYVQGDLFADVDTLRKVDVSWTSPLQVKSVLKKVIPSLESVNGKMLQQYRKVHPIIPKYITYKEKCKVVSSYGQAFLDHRLADGRVHTRFSQILTTGRVSSSAPNIQQVPADNAFRNCFTAPPGWVFVSSDYASQELNVIAYGANDPIWLEALKKGQDLHSVCADLVYGELWEEAAVFDCAYYKVLNDGPKDQPDLISWEADFAKAKCECPKHKALRQNVKTINFG